MSNVEYDGYLIKIYSKYTANKPVVLNKNNILDVKIHEHDNCSVIVKVISPKGIANVSIYSESEDDAKMIKEKILYDIESINLKERIFYTKDDMVRAINILANIVNRLYWETHKDCGGDWNEIKCQECNNYLMCKEFIALEEIQNKTPPTESEGS